MVDTLFNKISSVSNQMITVLYFIKNIDIIFQPAEYIVMFIYPRIYIIITTYCNSIAYFYLLTVYYVQLLYLYRTT